MYCGASLLPTVRSLWDAWIQASLDRVRSRFDLGKSQDKVKATNCVLWKLTSIIGCRVLSTPDIAWANQKNHFAWRSQTRSFRSCMYTARIEKKFYPASGDEAKKVNR